MKSFKDLLLEGQQKYNFRIKTVVQLDDEKLEDIERLLRRYDLISMGMPRKIANKDDSLEFRDIENADVFYVDVEIGLPISAYILQQELRSVLNIPEKFIVVRSDNEPIEVESTRLQLLRKLNTEVNEDELTPASLLSTDRFYLDAEQPPATDLYGDKYNKLFLNLLAKVAETRKNETFQTTSDTNDVVDMSKVRREPQQDLADFNDHLDTPKPVYKSKNMPTPVKDEYVSFAGNLDDDTKGYFSVARDKQGKKHTKVLRSDSVRDVKSR